MRPGPARTAILGVVACLGSATPAPAQRHFWDPETRVVITDAGSVLAVAAGPREVFAVTPRDILVRGILEDAWTLPIPLPVDAANGRPTALGLDPRAGGIWLGTAAGDLFSVTPGIWQWDRVAGAASGPVDAVIDGRDGFLYFRARGQWRRLAGGSLFPEPVPTSGLPVVVMRAADAGQDDPFFRAAAGTITLDPEQRSWRISDVATGPDPGLFWVATDGGGLVRFDSRRNTRAWYRFGTAATGTSSIAIVGDALWFGGNGAPGPAGVATASVDLGRWRQFDAGAGAPRGFVAEIVAAFDHVWFAASDGLYSLPAADARFMDYGPAAGSEPSTPRQGQRTRPRWRQFAATDGLPSERVRCLALAGDRLWVGTDRGAVAIDATGRVTATVLSGTRVSRMAGTDNGLLLASDAGLFRIDAAAHDPEPARILAPPLAGRVADVVATSEGPFIIVDGTLHRSGPGALPVRDAMLDRIGPALRLAWADGNLWVAGRNGIAVLDRGTGRWMAYTVPADLPAGPVTDVLATGDEVWAATPAGAVRLRWR